MKPEAYTSNDSDVDGFIDEGKPAAIKMLYDEPERMQNHILTFVYQNIKDNTGYWAPEFFESNGIDR